MYIMYKDGTTESISRSDLIARRYKAYGELYIIMQNQSTRKAQRMTEVMKNRLPFAKVTLDGTRIHIE